MKVSVIMITYNHEKYIKDAIEGILNQVGNFEIELIIGNDCSSDNTSKIINKCIASHTKGNSIVFIDRTINIGVSENFVDCLRRCTGEYIAICDGDDYWLNNKLVQQIENFSQGVSIVSNIVNVIKDEVFFKKIPEQNFNFSKEYSFIETIKSWPIQTSALVFDAQTIYSQMDLIIDALKLSNSADYVLIYFSLKLGSLKIIEDELSIYRIHGNGISNLNSIEKRTNFLSNMDNLYYFLLKNEKRAEVFRFLKKYYHGNLLNLSDHYLISNNYYNSTKYIIKYFFSFDFIFSFKKTKHMLAIFKRIILKQ